MFRRNSEEVETSEIFKDYAFRGFPLCPDPFLECQRFMNLAVYFIRARSLILSSCGSYLLYYACWSSRDIGEIFLKYIIPYTNI